MKRAVAMLVGFLIATAASAAGPFFLDHNGVLWSASADLNGLHLNGESGGTVVASSTIPFPYGAPGTNDTAIQVAADETTGKVAVVWQRNWGAGLSDVMLAVWQNGQWETVQTLDEDSSSNPRFPVVRVAQAADTVPDPADPTDPARATVVKDSFLEMVWWEGVADQQHGMLAIWQLTATSSDQALAFKGNLDRFVFSGVPDSATVPNSVIEHPQFAAQSVTSDALAFFASQHTGLFYLLRIGFTLTAPTTTADGGMTAATQRGRHIPIFGLTRVFPLTPSINMEGARVILGADLNPVAYRVNGPMIQYVTYGDGGWSPARTLAVTNGLTLDQAIPLVEDLAH